jgi:MFS family permease
LNLHKQLWRASHIAFVSILLFYSAAALGSSLEAYFSLDEEDVAWLFTVYSAPNLVLVFLGGVLMDRFGLVRTSLVFNLLVLVGVIVFACTPRGSAEVSMRYMICGRFLLGAGGECLCAGAQAMLARWFKNSEWLTFAMGLHSALVQLLGSAPAFVLLPFLLGDAARTAAPPGSNSGDAGPRSDGGNVRLCLWTVVIVAAISLIANVCYAMLDIRYGAIFVPMPEHAEFELQMGQDMLRLEKKQAAAASVQPVPRKPANAPSLSAKDGGAYHVVQSSGIEEVDVAPMAYSADELHDHPLESPSVGSNSEANGHSASDLSTSASVSSAPQSPGGELSSSGGEHTGLLGGLSNLWRHHDSGLSPPSFSLWKPWQSVRSLPGLFWAVGSMHCLLSPILYSFTAFGPQFFAEKYGMNPEEAGFVTSLLYVSIILAPLFGVLIDRVGYRATVQTCAAAAIPSLFCALHFTRWSPYGLMVGLGVAFAITEGNGLAMIADVSPSEQLGTSYGLVAVGTSVFLLFEPYAVGAIHLHTHGYSWATILFVIVSALGWLVSFAIYVFDVNHAQLMTQSASRRLAEHDAQNDLQAGQAYPELDIVFDEEAHEEDEMELDDVDELNLSELP